MSWFHALLSQGGANALLIVGSELDILNRYITVNFDPDVYGAGGTALEAADLQLIFTQNGGVATACSITSITKPNGNPLVGGEQQVKVNLSFTGNPSGVEKIEIKPSAAGSYEDGNGNGCSANDTTGQVTVYLEFDPNYKDTLALVLSNGDTVPTLSARLIQNAHIVGARSAGWFQRRDGWHFLETNFEYSKYDFVSKTKRGSITNTLQLVAFKGEKSFAGNSHLGLGWTASVNGVNYQQNSASIVAIVQNNDNTGAVTLTLIGATGTSGGANIGRMQITGRSSADQARYTANHNTSSASITNTSATDSSGVHHVDRNAASGADATLAYRNGTQVGTSSAASSALTERELVVHALNNNGTIGSWDANKYIQCVHWGASERANKDSISNLGQTYSNAMTALIPSAVADKFYIGAGQSELNGGGILWSSLTAQQLADYDIGEYSMANGLEANCYFKSEPDEPWAFLESRVNGITGSGATSQFGEIYVIAKAEAAKYPGEDLYFLWRPIDGTFIVNPSGSNIWLQGGVASSAWERFLDTYQAGILELDQVIQFMPVIWWQGTSESSDQDDGTLANNYQARELLVLDQFIDNTGATTFVVPQIHSGLPSGYPYKNTVRAAKTTNAAAVPYTLISMDDLTLNVQHPSPASQVIIAGLRISDEL